MLLSGNKPLLDPMLTYIYVIIWCHQAKVALLQTMLLIIFEPYFDIHDMPVGQ